METAHPVKFIDIVNETLSERITIRLYKQIKSISYNGNFEVSLFSMEYPNKYLARCLKNFYLFGKNISKSVRHKYPAEIHGGQATFEANDYIEGTHMFVMNAGVDRLRGYANWKSAV